MSSFFSVIQSVIFQLFTGTPIYKISTPAFIHCAKSALEVQREVLFSNKASLDVLNSVHLILDPAERLAAVLRAIIDPNVKWATDKPFNPVLGEFLHHHCDDYQFRIEQISHHPPKNSFMIDGPSFILSTPQGVSTGTAFSIGLNSVTVTLDDTPVVLQTSLGDIKWNHLTIKVDNLFTSRKAGYNGPVEIHDFSGIIFRGNLNLNDYKLTGQIIDTKMNNEVIKNVAGDLMNGIYDTKSNEKWIEYLPYEAILLKTDKIILEDPLYSQNVWGKVFKQMKSVSPNYSQADVEKVKVEAEQRLKDSSLFESRFGFNMKNLTY